MSVYTRAGKTVCDVQVTCPVPINAINRLSRTQALKNGRAAQLARTQKESKYRRICMINNLEFQALIFESTGRMETSCELFCKRAISYMARGDNTKCSIYTNYWMSRISCVIQQSIANAFLQRSTILNGNLVRETNFEFSDRFVVDHGIVN